MTTEDDTITNVSQQVEQDGSINTNGAVAMGIRTVYLIPRNLIHHSRNISVETASKIIQYQRSLFPGKDLDMLEYTIKLKTWRKDLMFYGRQAIVQKMIEKVIAWGWTRLDGGKITNIDDMLHYYAQKKNYEHESFKQQLYHLMYGMYRSRKAEWLERVHDNWMDTHNLHYITDVEVLEGGQDNQNTIGTGRDSRAGRKNNGCVMKIIMKQKEDILLQFRNKGKTKYGGAHLTIYAISKNR